MLTGQFERMQAHLVGVAAEVVLNHNEHGCVSVVYKPRPSSGPSCVSRTLAVQCVHGRQLLALLGNEDNGSGRVEAVAANVVHTLTVVHTLLPVMLLDACRSVPSSCLPPVVGTCCACSACWTWPEVSCDPIFGFMWDNWVAWHMTQEVRTGRIYRRPPLVMDRSRAAACGASTGVSR
jgi:hypothetical protein